MPLGVAATAHARTCTHHLQAVLSVMPEPLRPLVLRAMYPAIDTNRSLTVHCADSEAAAAVLRCAALSLSTHLTSLSLSVTLPQDSSEDSKLPWHHNAAVCAALGDVSAPLEHLDRLERLVLRVVGGCCKTLQRDHSIAMALPGLRRLTHLRLSGDASAAPVLQGLSHSLPALCMLRSLAQLDLSKGTEGIREDFWQDLLSPEALAGALNEMCELTHLSLTRHDLGYIDIDACVSRWEVLAPAVAALPLRSLHLQDCKLVDSFDLFSRGRGCSRQQVQELQELDLSGNNFTSHHARYFSRLPRLKSVAMQMLTLTAAAEEQLLQALLDNESVDLELLKLGHSRAGGEAVDALCRGLARWPRLHMVALSWDDLPTQTRRVPSGPSLIVLAPRLAALPQLRELCLGNMSVMKRAGAPPALGQVSALTKLKIEQLACSDVGADALASRICTLTGLRSVTISCHFEGNQTGRGIGAALVGGVATLSLLTCLSLAVRLMNAGAERLSAALTCMNSLREVHLPRNVVGSDGARALAETLPALSMLRVLDLTQNSFGDAGARALAVSLPRMRSLQQLGLGQCNLTQAGADPVLRAVPAGVHCITV